MSPMAWGLFGLLVFWLIILWVVIAQNGKKCLIFALFLFLASPAWALQVDVPKSVNQGGYFKVTINTDADYSNCAAVFSRRRYEAMRLDVRAYSALVPVSVSAREGRSSVYAICDYDGVTTEIEIKKTDFPIARGVTIIKQPTAAAKQRRARELKILESIYDTPIIERYFGEDLRLARPLAVLEATSPFGEVRRKRLLGTRIKWSSYHNGVDFRAPEGTKIFAAESGVVRVAQNWLGSGNTVIIDHGYGLLSLYFHLSKIYLKESQEIKRGQKIGLSGKSGNAYRPHLHFEIRLYGIPVNPLEFLQIGGVE